MPFKSEKQRKYMYSQHPEIAKRWSKKYGNKVHPSMEAVKHRLTSKKKK